MELPLSMECLPDRILVSGNGLYTLLEAQQHFRDLSELLVGWRKKGKSVRVLVDLSEGTPQTADVAAHIAHATQLIFKEGDRVAVVVTSTLVKLKVRRLHTRPGSDVFMTRLAAEEFLFRQDVGAL